MSDNASITVTRHRGYTLVYNDGLPEDGSLSARAWGVYCYLLSRPPGWETRVGHLRTVFHEGRDAIYTALKELVTAGLMDKTEDIENGLRRTRYTLDADQPGNHKPAGQAPDTDSQEPEKPDVAPDTDSQDAGHPDSEKPGQVTKERTTTDSVTDDSLRSSSARESSEAPQPALIPTPDGPNATSNGTKREVKRGAKVTPRLMDAEKAARQAQAEDIAKRWHDFYRDNVGPPANWRHVALRNMIEQALGEFSEVEITRALAELRRPLPSAPAWQDALLNQRNGTPVNGKPIANRHHEPPDSANRQARLKALEPTTGRLATP